LACAAKGAPPFSVSTCRKSSSRLTRPGGSNNNSNSSGVPFHGGRGALHPRGRWTSAPLIPQWRAILDGCPRRVLRAARQTSPGSRYQQQPHSGTPLWRSAVVRAGGADVPKETSKNALGHGLWLGWGLLGRGRPFAAWPPPEHSPPTPRRQHHQQGRWPQGRGTGTPCQGVWWPRPQRHGKPRRHAACRGRRRCLRGWSPRRRLWLRGLRATPAGLRGLGRASGPRPGGVGGSGAAAGWPPAVYQKPAAVHDSKPQHQSCPVT
jgi:hypothetical protein